MFFGRVLLFRLSAGLELVAAPPGIHFHLAARTIQHGLRAANAPPDRRANALLVVVNVLPPRLCKAIPFITGNAIAFGPDMAGMSQRWGGLSLIAIPFSPRYF